MVGPVVAPSFQRVRFVYVGIIHLNQQDRNSGVGGGLSVYKGY
jgi:hypothetical protein